MPNRFARRIRDGDIRTPGQLKSEFKALAKATHPDLAGHGAQEEFVRVRAEYESALSNFEAHRFGVRRAPRRGDPDTGLPGGDAVPVFAALGVLRRRGFPKIPRHEKERLRYEYARYRLETALDRLEEGRGGAVRDFEEALLGLRNGDPPLLASVLGYLDALTEYAARGLPAMRTDLAVTRAFLASAPALPGTARDFLARLSGDLGLEASLPGSPC